jgi:hypothetical protein
MKRLGPLDAAHTEPDNMRTLRAITETSAQRAESAICDGSGMDDSVSRLTSPHYSHA